MVIYLEKHRYCPAYRCFSFLLSFLFSFSLLILPKCSFAQVYGGMEMLPPPGTMVPMTPPYMPAIIKGMTVDLQNPLHFDFFVSTGDSHLRGARFEKEARKLVKYFLATLTTPDRDLWVNLSPYERNRIITEAFGVTEMGRDLLAQDYILKQITATLIYPEESLGKTFWDKVYAKAQAIYGKTDIPVDTFNKVWIVPDKAQVFEQGNTVVVGKTHLKVMLEEDFAAWQRSYYGDLNAINGYEEGRSADSTISSQVVRDIILPEIEKEVNNGETFAQLRQIYNSMILATWYKMNLKRSFLGQVYVEKNKVAGIDIEDKNEKEKIYNQYLEAFKTGVYNYIKEEYDPETEQIIEKKYFSGGFDAMEIQDVIAADLVKLPAPSEMDSLSEEMKREVAEGTAAGVAGDMAKVSIDLAAATPQTQESGLVDNINNGAFDPSSAEAANEAGRSEPAMVAGQNLAEEFLQSLSRAEEQGSSDAVRKIPISRERYQDGQTTPEQILDEAIDVFLIVKGVASEDREGPKRDIGAILTQPRWAFEGPDGDMAYVYVNELTGERAQTIRGEGEGSEVVAANAENTGTPVGGIDLNSAMLALQIERDEFGIPLPIARQPTLKDMQINGFLPLITNITPIPSLPAMLGINATATMG
jgi:hypothetical protein